MSTTEMIQQALEDGVIIATDGTGNIKLIGDQTTVDRWLPTIRENKPAILAALTPRQTPTPCKGCTRLEAVEILGEFINGCLYVAPGLYPDGWRRLPADLTKCLFH